jgi:mRNA-degrading endonuclease RelE of RelBE toxin-antitoxin system
MNFDVVILAEAKREVKSLSKRYKSFKDDLLQLILSLEAEPQQGEPLGKDCFKIRLAVSSKNKGKSGGARIITCVKIVAETVFIIAVYDKSDFDSIPDKVIDDRLKEVNL